MFTKLPPSIIEINNVSVNALKCIYSICKENPAFLYAKIDWNSKTNINLGISCSVIEKLYGWNIS